MTGKRKNSKTNWAKVDAHVITPEEYEEAPEWTDEMFDSANFYVGGKLVRRGRPKGSGKKISTTIRFDEDILAHFKATGRGWQTKINEALRGIITT
jgi:uncharacterized protein (DUF4415 family)